MGVGNIQHLCNKDLLKTMRVEASYYMFSTKWKFCCLKKIPLASSSLQPKKIKIIPSILGYP